MMRRWTATALMVSALGVVGCESTPEEPETLVPEAKQARFVESTSPSEVMIRATGIGADVAAAESDARRTAIWHVLHGGDDPLLSSAEARDAFKAHEEEVYGRARSFIAWEGDILSKGQEGDQRVVEKRVRVNVRQLSELLERRDVIAAQREILDQVGRPKIAVVPEKPEREDDVRPAITIISEYLQQRGFDVEVPRAGKEVDDVVRQAAALEGESDPMYELALQVGSDVYITVDVEASSRRVGGTKVQKASIASTAYYTATGDQLGASTGHSKEREVSSFSSLMESAASEAANRVLNQIEESWVQEMERGSPFKVVVSTSEAQSRDVSRQIHRLFNDVCSEASRNAAGATSFDYTLRCRDHDEAMDLLLDLEAGYAGPGRLERVLDSGALLILQAGKVEGDADDIQIR